MKKVYHFWISLTAVLAIGIMASCEGPAGPAGPAGEDGVDGNITCMECHATEVIDTKEAEFALSAHSSGAIAVDYAGGRASCAKCHSHEGFVQYANTGSVLGDITNPSAWECKTCHGLHETFETDDYALRLAEPIVPLFDETLTMDLNGNSNLCANCHQTRRAEPNVTNPGEAEFRITSTHYGPHHGPQANVLYGAGFAEISGNVAYPDAGSGNHLSQASCTGCHMGEESDATGGHSFWPNKDACNSCHTGSDLTDNFDYGGVQTEVQQKLDQLRDKLIELGVVEGDEVEGYHPVVGTYPMIQAQAFFNWIGLVEDRSLGAHNPKYVKALLQNTLAALD